MKEEQEAPTEKEDRVEEPEFLKEQGEELASLKE